MKKRIWALVAATLLGLGGVTVTAAPAQASASGCTWAPYGYVCGNVIGSGVRVTEVYVSRGKADPSLICSYRGRMTVWNVEGRKVYDKWTATQSGCVPARAYLTIHRGSTLTFPNNSKLCTNFYEYGVQQGGGTCFAIYQ
jgi:hypothetical protein